MAASPRLIAQEIPSVLTYTPPENLPPPQKSIWSRLTAPLGIVLRNGFFLPLYNSEKPLPLQLDEKIAAARLQNRVVFQGRQSDHPCKEYEFIQKHFHMRDIAVHVEGPIVRIFNVRLFESKQAVAEKKLRVILFTFNGNREHDAKVPFCTRAWNPLTLAALSEGPLLVLRAFQEARIYADSLKLVSLGAITLEGLNNLPSRESIPQTLVIDRGIASVAKTANKLYWRPKSYVLRAMAWLCGWSGDPENSLLRFLQRGKIARIVLAEARGDRYFAGEGAFAPDFHQRVAALGSSIFRAAFWVFGFHPEGHHAAPITSLEKNAATRVDTNTANWFPLEEGETMESALARNVFFGGSREWHTCFCVGGADTTQNVGTFREVLPLLRGFVKEGSDREAAIGQARAS